MKVLLQFGLWKLGLAEAETQTSEAERDCLARHASGKIRLAEIGVWHGVTSCRLRGAMAAQGTLFAIDPYPVGRLGFSAQQVIAQTELSRIPNGSVQWVRKTGAKAADDFASAGTEPFDFVFIDGDHSYEGLQADWRGWRELVTRSGIIALHDSRPTDNRPIHEAGSVQFTNAVILKDPGYEVVETVDSLTVLRRC
jgi:predicted O-methyltransferase YrrM